MSLESNCSAESYDPNAPLSNSLQPMSIRKINLKKLTADYEMDHKTTKNPSLELLAKYIIQKYNDKRLQADPTEIQNKFETQQLDDCNFSKIESKGYSVVHSHCSVTVKSSISNVLKSLRVFIDSSCSVSHLFIFFREMDDFSEMFALCSGTSGYVPTVEYTDYSFPKSIACRLLDPTSRSKQSTKSLCGDVISSHDVLRSCQLYNPNEVHKLYSNFTARLRADASIFALDDFRTKRGKVPKTEMDIQEGGIRIRKRISLECYFLIFEHFSKICRGEATYAYLDHKVAIEESSSREEQDDKDGFDFMFFYSPVPYDTKSKLDDEVLQTIKQFYYKKQFHPWELYHPKTDDYFQALRLRLKYSNKNENVVSIPWSDSRRSYEDIITMLRQEKFRNCLINTSNTFEEELGNVYLGYHNGRKWVDEKLIKCLSGLLEHETKVYFKFNAKWYETSEDLHYKINQEFRNCMTNCLIDENEEGFLPHPWQPNDELTVSRLSKRLGLTENDVEDILKTKVSFIDNNSNVNQKKLRGEILLVPEVNYHKVEIETLLQKPSINITELEDKFGDDIANTIFGQLQQRRTVGRIIDHKKWQIVEVRNAFFPQKQITPSIAFNRQQMDNLYSAEQAFLWKMDEEAYNRTYLFDSKNIKGIRQPYDIDQSGWIVGDQILPDGIELFDVMQYTPNKIFLYHVKESFGQKTRDACSQIRNSLGMINNAVMSNHENNVLDKFYKLSIATTTSKFRERVKAQMVQFDNKCFRKLFRKKAREDIVFVYAFADDRLNPHVIRKAQKTKFTLEDFSFADDKKERLFKELVTQGYLNQNGDKTLKVEGLNRKDKLIFPKTLNNYKNKVWKVLTGDHSHFKSLIGRMEVLYARQQVEGLGYSFKICQIQRPSYKSPCPAVSIWGNAELKLHAKNLASVNNVNKKIKEEDDSSMDY